MESYKKLSDVLTDVNNLGNWNDPKEEIKYREVLYKICHLYHQFEEDDSHNLFFALRDICSKKFPDDKVYDKDGFLKNGLPVIDSFLALFIWNDFGLDIIVKQTSFEHESKEIFGKKQILKSLTKQEKELLKTQADLYVSQIKQDVYEEEVKEASYC